MIALTVAEAARLLSADLVGPSPEPATITGVVVDSRRVEPGSLFVALPGERVDGHDFVVDALSAGAAAALTARPVPGAPGACLVVPDPLAALGRLARHLVDTGRRGGLRVVAITGSQGKTSTKDLLAQVLETAGPTVAPYGNLNNEIGLPLTVARLTAQSRFLVAEMGARGVGHVAYLCRIAPPDVAVVLNVGHAHLGEFGSQQAIAKAKAELVEALPADGTAVLNVDDPLVWAMRTQAAAVLATSALAEPATDFAVWAEEVRVGLDGCPRFRLHARLGGQRRGEAEVALAVSGRHQVANAVAAAGAALALDLDLAQVAAGLEAARPRSRWRMELHHRPDGVLVVNDAYNANPESMRAAVETVVGMRRPPAGRLWAVLGDMLELGAATEEQHRALGAYVARSGFDRLVVVGRYADLVVTGARTAASSVTAELAPDKAAAVRTVLAGLAPSDVVLIKASRGLALETVADEVLAGGAAAPATDPGQPTSEDST